MSKEITLSSQVHTEIYIYIAVPLEFTQEKPGVGNISAVKQNMKNI